MKIITVEELRAWRETGVDHQLIDVREEYEYEDANLGGALIPLGTILHQAEQIRRDVPVVVMCRSGKRSATAIMQLQAMLDFTNLCNLEGGILQWASEIGPPSPSTS
jgi:rhodanese-related sulfurtransferase